MDNVERLVASGGRLFISIYNDQGLRTRIWRCIKRTYNTLPASLRTPFVVAVMGPRELLSLAAQTAAGDPAGYVRGWTEYKRSRGMSRWHDLVDWVGGYPFEVAKPEEIFSFFRERGFTLVSLITAGGGLGCNQFVFERES
jgi:2-polyprenyl-6-hydroxyphenyl methylase/3-demethylubiquinone-9 3-methyltransferase